MSLLRYFQWAFHIFKEEGRRNITRCEPSFGFTAKQSTATTAESWAIFRQWNYIYFLSRDLESALTKTYSWVTGVLEGKLPFESLAADTKFIMI